MTRQDAISHLLNKELLVVSLGKFGRELWAKKRNAFYVAGSMGCALGIGLGLALNTDKKVCVAIGDGALIMKLGSFATYLKEKPENLEVIVFNTGSHDSTGGQPTAFESIRPFIDCEILDVPEFEGGDIPRPEDPKEITKAFVKQI